MPMLPSCEGRRWEAAWRGSRDGPPDTELQRRMKDSPLAPSPASVPEIPPSGYERESLFYCKYVCLMTSVLRDAGWLSASAVGHCPRGRWGRSGEEQILTSLCLTLLYPF